jgi:hypothetical protein
MIRDLAPTSMMVGAIDGTAIDLIMLEAARSWPGRLRHHPGTSHCSGSQIRRRGKPQI